jgi:hypothetical protein
VPRVRRPDYRGYVELGFFCQIADNAHLERSLDKLGIAVGRENENFCLGCFAEDLSRKCAVEAGPPSGK